MRITPVPFQKLCTARFIYRIALKPVLSNWHTIIAYYKQVKEPTERQSKLKLFFVDREAMVKLKLNFI